MPGNVRFYAGPVSDAPDELSFHLMTKDPKKLMGWIDMSPKGVTKSVILQSGTNVDGSIYREMCLRKGLLPFIDA